MKTNTKAIAVIIQVIIMCFFLSRCKSPAPKETSATQKTDTITAVEPDKTKKTDTVTTGEPGKTDAKAATDKGASSVPLTLIIKNLASSTAPVTVGVYGPKNKFPDPNDQLKVYKFKPQGQELTAKIADLKFGTYALAIYQDVNSSGKINKNLVGIPTEPYAFSNNFKPKLKAPGFDDCKFEYSAKTNTLTMTMIK